MRGVARCNKSIGRGKIAWMEYGFLVLLIRCCTSMTVGRVCTIKVSCLVGKEEGEIYSIGYISFREEDAQLGAG